MIHGVKERLWAAWIKKAGTCNIMHDHRKIAITYRTSNFLLKIKRSHLPNGAPIFRFHWALMSQVHTDLIISILVLICPNSVKHRCSGRNHSGGTQKTSNMGFLR